jgi:hypothetical protein
MADKKKVGDVHAPVEDVEVPLGLKLLVLIMVLVLSGLITLAVLWANQLGIFVIDFP